MTRPIGYFVHHQGRGHAERCLALVQAFPVSQPVTIFCAKADLFPSLPPHITLIVIPSLFEPGGTEAPAMANLPTPRTLHCAPLGWPGIRKAMGVIACWFAQADPALMICDVSAEIAQLARICSVPHVKILQHGDRADEGHRAAYDGAVGILAPFSEQLAQPEWPASMRARTFFAGGLGRTGTVPKREAARHVLGIDLRREVILVMSGGGGTGFAQAPVAVGARARPDALWLTIGTIERAWHATEPGNIRHHGWIDNAADYIAAADLVIASTGNTTCQQILAAARPWLAVPEWRYFDEQHRKAECLDKAGMAVRLDRLPASAQAWHDVLDRTYTQHRPDLQHAAIDDQPAVAATRWLLDLIDRLWAHTPSSQRIFPS